MYCKYCGKKISENSKFCSYCGKSLKKIKNDKKVNECPAGRAEKKYEVISAEPIAFLEYNLKSDNNEKQVKTEIAEDPACLYDLAQDCISMEDFDKSDTKRYIELLEKSANGGYAKAQYELGKMYESGGLFVEKNVEKAKELLEKAAAQGDEGAIYSMQYLTNPDFFKQKKRTNDINDDGLRESDFSSIFEDCKKAAEQGIPVAQFNLCSMYFKGKFVKRNYKKAVMWYEKAVEQGFVRAMFPLAYMYYNGIGGKQDCFKAFNLYEKLASQGDSFAQYNIGNMYYNGEGIEQNYVKAFEWYEKAANQKFLMAQFNLGFLFYTGNGVKQDSEKARYWWEKAAFDNNPYAMLCLSLMYLNGNTVEKSESKADELFLKARNLLDPETIDIICDMYAKQEFHCFNLVF